MGVGMLIQIVKQIFFVLAIAFFFYAVYQGVMGGGGSTSVFTGVGALVVVLLGSYVIDKFVNDY